MARCLKSQKKSHSTLRTKTKTFGQTVLPDMSIWKWHKIVKMPDLKWDIFSDFKHCVEVEWKSKVYQKNLFLFDAINSQITFPPLESFSKIMHVKWRHDKSTSKGISKLSIRKESQKHSLQKLMNSEEILLALESRNWIIRGWLGLIKASTYTYLGKASSQNKSMNANHE